MRMSRPSFAVGIALWSCALLAQAGIDAELQEAAEAAIPNSKQIDLSSRAGRDYRIFVAWPPGEPPASGFPVIYVLDANSVFGTVVETLRIQQRYPAITGVSPAVVVGIGYPVTEPFDQQRRALDFVRSPAEFLEFIEAELRPSINRNFKIDASRQALFGHSSGGYFVLHALFTRPHSFQAYISISPDPHDPRLERQFMREVGERCRQGSSQRIGVLLAAAEHERTLSPLMLKLPEPQRQARLTQMQADARVDKARALAARLAEQSRCGIDASFIEFAAENHASVLPVAINRMLPFATAAR